jgi:general secretion pathway protein F
MQKKVQGAMIYPIILMLMSFGIVMGLMTYVVPEIVKTFDQSKDALPWITVALMKASDFIRHAWVFIILFACRSIGFCPFLKTTAGIMLLID